MFDELWKKIVTAIGVIVAVWLIIPLPEITILVGLFGGESISQVLNIPRWVTYAGSLIGALIGTLVAKKIGLFDKVREWL